MQISKVMRKGTEISNINSKESCIRTTCHLKGIYIRVLPLLNFSHFLLTQFWAYYRWFDSFHVKIFLFKKMTCKEWINCLRSSCPELRHDRCSWLCLYISNRENLASHTGSVHLGAVSIITFVTLSLWWSSVVIKVFRLESFQPKHFILLLPASIHPPRKTNGAMGRHIELPYG